MEFKLVVTTFGHNKIVSCRLQKINFKIISTSEAKRY